MSTERPNIILFLSDEHCGFAMSHAGDPNVRTPAMDRLTETREPYFDVLIEHGAPLEWPPIDVSKP